MDGGGQMCMWYLQSMLGYPCWLFIGSVLAVLMPSQWLSVSVVTAGRRKFICRACLSFFRLYILGGALIGVMKIMGVTKASLFYPFGTATGRSQLDKSHEIYVLSYFFQIY